MKTIIEDLKSLTQKTYDLNSEMEKKLVEIVNECGGENKLIRTDIQRVNENLRTTIYGYLFDEGLDKTTEHRIMAITIFENDIFENELAVLFGEEYEVFGDMTDEEILELDSWHSIFGGLIMSNVTLYNLCENIAEYI